MTTVPLSVTTSIILDGTGKGTASIGPLSAREKWTLAQVHVMVNTNVAEATCNLYVGDVVSQRNYRGGTFSGSSGDSTDLTDTVTCGQKVFAVWSNGDPIASATLVITGSRDI